MFTETSKKYKVNDPKLVQRFFEIHEISDWKKLPKEVLMTLSFSVMPQFWAERSRWLGATDTDKLLDKTRIEDRDRMDRDSELLKFSDITQLNT